MMKSLITLMTCGSLLLGLSAVTIAQDTSKKETEVSVTEHIKLEVEGMVCSMCEESCKKSLEELDGVKVESVSASEGIARLTVTGKKPISDKKLKKAVENAGFKLKKVHRSETNDSNNEANE